MASDLCIRANNLFRPHIEFLCGTLPLLDDMKLKLQTPKYKTYCTLQRLRRAFAAPVLKDVSGAADNIENHVKRSEVRFHCVNLK